eukprot:2852854-Prymnesium_polylepis.1
MRRGPWPTARPRQRWRRRVSRARRARRRRRQRSLCAEATCGVCEYFGLPEERCRPMSREPALE